jgi:hypothetical protein
VDVGRRSGYVVGAEIEWISQSPLCEYRLIVQQRDTGTVKELMANGRRCVDILTERRLFCSRSCILKSSFHLVVLSCMSSPKAIQHGVGK